MEKKQGNTKIHKRILIGIILSLELVVLYFAADFYCSGFGREAIGAICEKNHYTKAYYARLYTSTASREDYLLPVDVYRVKWNPLMILDALIDTPTEHAGAYLKKAHFSQGTSMSFGPMGCLLEKNKSSEFDLFFGKSDTYEGTCTEDEGATLWFRLTDVEYKGGLPLP